MTILKRLEEGRIFSVDKIGFAFMFQEECDRHYVEELSRDEVLKLADEMIELANNGVTP
jgi:hypothetical protein